MFNRTSTLTGMMILALMLTGCVSSGGIDPAIGNWNVVTDRSVKGSGAGFHTP